MFAAYSVEALIRIVDEAEVYFGRSTAGFVEADSRWAPAPGALSVAGHFLHTARTLEWFVEGVFTDSGWNMNFGSFMKEDEEAPSVEAARARMVSAFELLRKTLRAQTPGSLGQLLPPDDPIFPGLPKGAVIEGIIDHTAHHRGALTVYARLLGKPSKMPYMP